MSYRLPRIEFSRSYYVAAGLDALGLLAAGNCITTKFAFNMVGESPWVNNTDIVLTQVDIIEYGASLAKKNYKLFLSTKDFTAAAPGSAFSPDATATEADLDMIKGYIDCSTAYVDLGANISTQYNRSINHRISFATDADGASLFAQLVLNGTVTFGAANTLLIKCHFALQ